MFTGIVQEVGSVEEIQPLSGGIRMRVAGPRCARELEIGRSISVNGTCLTVVRKGADSFEVEVVEETLRKTAFGERASGDRVNLELPMRLNDRLDGHFVLGHVDTVGEVLEIGELPGSRMFTILVPGEFSRHCIPAGSIAVDGVSLTIAEAYGSSVRIAIIPHTLRQTIFQYYTISDNVNLEFDVIGKYVARLLHEADELPPEEKFLSEKHLRELGS